MEAIKTLFGLIVKLILVSIGIFLLFCLAGYVMAEHNEDAGLMVLLGGLALIPLWFMRGLVGRFVKASAIAIIGLVGISAVVYGVLTVAPNIADGATEDNMAMVLGFFVMLVVALVAVKVLQGIGSMFGGSSSGGSHSSEPSGPKQHTWYVTMKCHKKTDRFFSPSTSDGFVKTQRYKATDKNDAITQATQQYAEVLLTGRAKITNAQISYIA